jgi:hypothetical protein
LQPLAQKLGLGGGSSLDREMVDEKPGRAAAHCSMAGYDDQPRFASPATKERSV